MWRKMSFLDEKHPAAGESNLTILFFNAAGLVATSDSVSGFWPSRLGALKQQYTYTYILSRRRIQILDLGD